MKIIQITPSYKPAFIYGGPTMSVAKLCEALTSNNPNLEVLTTTANGQEELDVEPNVPIKVDNVQVTYFKRITKDHTHFSPALLLALRRKISEQRAWGMEQGAWSKEQGATKNGLIIHIHSWWNLVTIFSCLVAKRYRVPVVLSPRGMLTNYTQNNRNSFFKAALHTLIGKSLLKYVHIIASSEQEKQDTLKIIQPKSITILPNLVNLPQTNDEKRSAKNDQRSWSNEEQKTTNEKQSTTNEKPFKLLFLSRIEEKKGLDILFNALAQLNLSWALTIGGAGDSQYVEYLKAQSETLKINKNIIWLGHINNENKFETIANHDLLVLTSHNENFANVVIESLYVGTPVLLSRQVGLSNYVKDNDLGFITDLDSNQISGKLVEAYTNVDKRNRIRSVAPGYIERDFNEKELAKKYLALYEHILTLD